MGEQADYNMRNQFGGDLLSSYLNSGQSGMNAYNSALMSGYNSTLASNNNIRGQAAGYATQGQIQSAQGALQPSMNYYSDLMNGGARYNEALASQSDAINSSARTQAGDLNTGLAARGLGGNAYAGQAIRQKGEFAAGGARGQLGTQLHNQGAAGYTDVSKAWADYAARPTQEGAMALMQTAQMPQFQQSWTPDQSYVNQLYGQYTKPPQWLQDHPYTPPSNSYGGGGYPTTPNGRINW